MQKYAEKAKQGTVQKIIREYKKRKCATYLIRRKIHSQKGLFGVTNHYEASGCKIGYSMDSLLGGRNHYDRSGSIIGYTTEGILGESQCGRGGEKTGYSTDGLFGQSTTLTVDEKVFFGDDWKIARLGAMQWRKAPILCAALCDHPSSRRYLYTVGLLSSHTRASSLMLRFPLMYSG